jgi:hypothetical protein
MKRKKLARILNDFYEDALPTDHAWDTYLNFLKMYKSADEDTVEFMYNICNMTKKDMLRWRTRLAEKGFELTPNEIEQYILIAALVMHLVEPDN